MTEPSNQRFSFANIDAVILDMDGVIWRGVETLPGVPDFFLFLQQQKIPYLMATNNSSKNVSEYVARLSNLGVPVTDDNIVTSGLVTVTAMLKMYPPQTPIYVVGSDSLSALLTSHGFVIDAKEAKAVVVGLDVKLSYEKLTTAGRRILDGADFIGTNADRSIPTQDGISLGCGSILAAIEAMTGRAPRVMGKPEPIMFQVALERLHSAPERTLMIGDRLDTDIEGALRAGLRAAMVLTGVSTRAETGAIMPDGIYEDLATLHKEWVHTL